MIRKMIPFATPISRLRRQFEAGLRVLTAGLLVPAGVCAGLALGVSPVGAQSVTIEPATLARVPTADVGNGRYWQQLRIDLGHDDAASSETVTIDLPEGIVVRDSDDDGALFDEVRVVYRAVGAELPRFQASTTTTATRIVVESQERAGAGGRLYVQFPIRTTATPTALTTVYQGVQFADSREQDLSSAALPTLTFVAADEFAANGSMGLVDLAAPLAAGADTTTTARGTWFPSDPAMLVLNLPDLVFDAGLASPNRVTGHGDGDDGNDTHYRFFFSEQALDVVDASVATPARRVVATGDTLYTETEGQGESLQLVTRDLPAGNYWLYVTADATGSIPLGRSRVLVVRHEPVIERLGPTGTAPLTFDSGGLLDSTGTANGDGLRRLSLDLRVVDHDDSAVVHLFYSGNPNLGPSNVSIEGETAFLQGAEAITIVDGLAEETTRFDWDTVGPPLVPEGDYYVYAVAVGGSQSTIDRTTRQIQVRHAPFLRLDATLDGGVADTIVTGGPRPQRFLSLTWGRSGPTGDADADDDATIDLYVGSRTDFAVPGGAAEVEAAAATGDGIRLIAAGLSEDADARADNQFVWDLWSLEGSADVPQADVPHAVYAVIADSAHRRLVRMDGGRAGDTGSTIHFAHPPVIRPLQPAADLNVGPSSARVSWQDMDLDDDARIRIVLSAEDHGEVSDYAVVTAGLAFVVNSADGRALPAVDPQFDLSEDSAIDHYDVETAHLARSLNADGAPQPGSYTVYLAITEQDTFDSRAVAWRAPGRLNYLGPAADETQPPPFELLPRSFTIGNGGGTQRMEVVVDAAGDTVDLVVLTLRLDPDRFDVVDADTTVEGVQPFTVAPGFSRSKLAANAATLVEGEGLFLTFEYFDPVPAGIPGLGGNLPLVRFDLIALSGAGSEPLQLVSDAEAGRLSQLERDGAVVQAPAPAELADALIVEGRAAVGGRVVLEGRGNRAAVVDVALRHWGEYADVVDSLFRAANDEDEDRPGVQVTLDAEGDFALVDVPAGRFDLHVRRPGYLEGRVTNLELTPGAVVGNLRPSTHGGATDSLMLGGDVTGYDDVSSGGEPDNEVTLADWDYIASLFGQQVDADADSARADISGDGVVNIRDLSLVGANFRARGPRPVYRRTQQAATSRLQSSMAGDTLVVDWYVDGVVPHAVEAELTFDTAAWELLGASGAPRALSAAEGAPGRLHLASASLGGAGLDPAQPLARWHLLSRGAASPAPRLSRLLLLDGEHADIPVADVTTAVASGGALPQRLRLQPNYPNPFNPATTLEIAVPAAAGNLRLEIFDVLGQRVATLVDGDLAPGLHRLRWEGRDLRGRPVASGVYYARLVGEGVRHVHPMLLLR
jgi:hypothetical protein